MIELWERRGYRTAVWAMLVPFGWALGWAGSNSISWMAALAFPYLLLDIAVHARGLVVVAVLGAKKARVLWPMLTVLVPPLVFIVLAMVGPQEHSGGLFDTPAPVALLIAHFLASIPFALGIDMASRQKPRESHAPGFADVDFSVRKWSSGDRSGNQRDRIYRNR